MVGIGDRRWATGCSWAQMQKGWRVGKKQKSFIPSHRRTHNARPERSATPPMHLVAVVHCESCISAHTARDARAHTHTRHRREREKFNLRSLALRRAPAVEAQMCAPPPLLWPAAWRLCWQEPRAHTGRPLLQLVTAHTSRGGAARRRRWAAHWRHVQVAPGAALIAGRPAARAASASGRKAARVLASLASRCQQARPERPAHTTTTGLGAFLRWPSHCAAPAGAP